MNDGIRIGSSAVERKSVSQLYARNGHPDTK